VKLIGIKNGIEDAIRIVNGIGNYLKQDNGLRRYNLAGRGVAGPASDLGISDFHGKRRR